MKRAIALLALLTLAPFAFPQVRDQVALGFNPNRMYQFGDVDHVNLFNGDLILNVPIATNYGIDEGLAFQMGLTYNSKVWSIVEDIDPNTPDEATYARAYPHPRTNAGLGWRFSLGALIPPWDPNNHSAAENPHSWQYIGPAGDEHDLGFYCHSFTDCSAQYAAGSTAYTFDASYIAMYLQDSANAYVFFPSGEVKKFQLIEQRWRLTEIHSPLGGKLTISYTFDFSSPRRITRWTIVDPNAGRTHYVNFRSMTGSQLTVTDDYGQIVDSIEVQSVNTARVTYQFNYELLGVTRPCEQTHDFITGLDPTTYEPRIVNLPVLRSISLPDGSSWAFTYRGDQDCQSGLVATMTLPTGGVYQYSYGLWYFPPNVLCDGGADASLKESAGVLSRTVDGAQWHYYHDYAFQTPLQDPSFTPCTQCPDPQNGYVDPSLCHRVPPTDLPSRWIRTSVLNPRGDRADYYFSGWSMDPADPTGMGSHMAEYGLPYTRGMYDDGSTTEHQTKDSAGRFLSTQTFGNCGAIDAHDPILDEHLGNNGPCTGTPALLRTTYVGYDHDGVGIRAAQLNARVASDRTEYNDDPVSGVACTSGSTQCRYADTDRSGWDQFGHYRTETTSGNFAGTNSVTTFTNYNPGDRPPGTWAPGEHPPVTGWNLETYTEQKRSSGSTVNRSLFCFDPIGYLLRRRTIKDTSTGAAGGADVVTRYTRSVYNATATVTEEVFGGDGQNIGSDDVSTFCGATFTLPVYTTHYEIDSGIVRLAQPWQNGQAMFDGIRREIDYSTGLVTKSFDSAGVATTYNYDSMGRLITVTPPPVAAPGVPIATTSYVYAPATSTTFATVDEISSAAIGPRKQYQFDRMGRLWREKTVMPSQAWTVRETLYDVMGWKSSVSEPAMLPGVDDDHFVPPYRTRYDNYDPFGRPGRITAPDGTEMTMSYKGVASASRTVHIATAPGQTNTPATTTETQDRFGRLIDVLEPDGVHTAYGYDAGGNLTDVCMNASGLAIFTPCSGQRRTFHFDGRGWLSDEQHPENGIFRYEYDARGHVTRRYRDDVAAFDLHYDYDRAERLAGITGGAGILTSFAYGTNALTSSDRNNGKLITAIRHNYLTDNGTTRDYTITERYYYEDTAGRRNRKVTEIYDPAAGAAKSFEQSQTFNELSLPATASYPACASGCTQPSFSVTNAFSYGLLTGISSSGTKLADFQYAPGGTNTAIDHYDADGAKITDTYTLDNMSRPSQIEFGSLQCALPSVTASAGAWSPGSAVTLTATVAGPAAPRDYQWFDASTGQPINGATAATYTTAPLASGAQFFIRVTNGCGHTDSAVVTVGNASCSGPSIATQPVSQTISSGTAVSLSVSLVQPATAPSFQWQQSNNSGASWTSVGTNSATFVSQPLTVSTWFRVVVTGCGLTVYSDPAVITVSTSFVFPQPSWLEAHNIGGTTDRVAWATVPGATQYTVYRRNGSLTSWSYVATVSGADCTSSQCVYTDNSFLQLNTTYVYGVNASDADIQHHSSLAMDFATTMTFAAPVAHSTVVLKDHFDQLLAAVNAVRASGGQAAVQWSTILQPAGVGQPAAPNLHVSAVAEHILALRREMDAAIRYLGFTPQPYTDSALTAATIKAVHLTDLQREVY